MSGMYTFPFGKHKGKTFDAVLEEDPSYLIWVMESVDLDCPFGDKFTFFMNQDDVVDKLRKYNR